MGLLYKLKTFKWGYILLSLIIAAMGVCFIAFQEALKTLAIVIGVTVAVVGIIMGVAGIAGKKRGAGFAFQVSFAVLLLISGIVTAIFNEKAVEIMVAVFSLLLIVDASFKLHTSAMSKRYHVVGWWIIMVLSVIGIVSAFYLIKFMDYSDPDPVISYSTVLGIVMLINAINNFLSAFYVASFERNMSDDIYYDRRYREKMTEEENNGQTEEKQPAISESAPTAQVSEAPAAEPTAEQTSEHETVLDENGEPATLHPEAYTAEESTKILLGVPLPHEVPKK